MDDSDRAAAERARRSVEAPAEFREAAGARRHHEPHRVADVSVRSDRPHRVAVQPERPVDGGARLRVELSGLPMFDRARNFVGYRGFGVCRDLDGLARHRKVA